MAARGLPLGASPGGIGTHMGTEGCDCPGALVVSAAPVGGCADATPEPNGVATFTAASGIADSEDAADKPAEELVPLAPPSSTGSTHDVSTSSLQGRTLRP